jgi:hypothetical protein
MTSLATLPAVTRKTFAPEVCASVPLRFAAGADGSVHEYSPAIELTEAPSVGAVPLKRAQELAPALSHLGHPPPVAGRRPVGDHQLDIGVRPIGRAVVTAFPVRVDRAYEVQVLRHRPPSIPPADRDGEAGGDDDSPPYRGA